MLHRNFRSSSKEQKFISFPSKQPKRFCSKETGREHWNPTIPMFPPTRQYLLKKRVEIRRDTETVTCLETSNNKYSWTPKLFWYFLYIPATFWKCFQNKKHFKKVVWKVPFLANPSQNEILVLGVASPNRNHYLDTHINSHGNHSSLLFFCINVFYESLCH